MKAIKNNNKKTFQDSKRYNTGNKTNDIRAALIDKYVFLYNPVDKSCSYLSKDYSIIEFKIVDINSLFHETRVRMNIGFDKSYLKDIVYHLCRENYLKPFKKSRRLWAN